MAGSQGGGKPAGAGEAGTTACGTRLEPFAIVDLFRSRPDRAETRPGPGGEARTALA
jgi:hypothetical protein